MRALHCAQRRRKPLAPLLCALALAASPGAAQPWHYTIGVAKAEQQANFCDSEHAVERLATTFESFGPRTGYTALSESDECTLATESFTPLAIVRMLTVAEGEPEEYVLHFVRVRTESKQIRYLVTTRAVKE